MSLLELAEYSFSSTSLFMIRPSYRLPIVIAAIGFRSQVVFREIVDIASMQSQRFSETSIIGEPSLFSPVGDGIRIVRCRPFDW
jgi:hypothetical protein